MKSGIINICIIYLSLLMLTFIAAIYRCFIEILGLKIPPVTAFCGFYTIKSYSTKGTKQEEK